MKLSNGVVFQNRQEDLYDTKEFVEDLERYIEPTDELSAVLLENGQLKAVSQSTLWYGFRGLNVKLFLSEWRDKLAELNQFQKEKVTGKFEGKTITISRQYGDHRFTDQELRDLYEGKEISITFTTQWGNSKTITGKLDKKDWPEKEIIFWGFISKSVEEKESNFIEGVYKGQQIKFKNSFSDHKYTEDEINKLLNGESIYIIITNKNGKQVAVRIKLIQYQNDYYKAHPDFEVPPVYWAGHNFTVEEIEHLHMGRSLNTNLISSKGNIYPAEIRWRDGKLQRKVKDGWK